MAGTQKSPRKEVRRPVWAEVSLGALKYNLDAIRKYVNPAQEKRKAPRKIRSVVKGNGYGHGGPPVAQELDEAESDGFRVTRTGEGVGERAAAGRHASLAVAML